MINTTKQVVIKQYKIFIQYIALPKSTVIIVSDNSKQVNNFSLALQTNYVKTLLYIMTFLHQNYFILFWSTFRGFSTLFSFFDFSERVLAGVLGQWTRRKEKRKEAYPRPGPDKPALPDASSNEIYEIALNR